MFAEPTLIEVDFELPDHSNELSKAEEIIDKLKNRLKIIKLQKRIDDKTHSETFEEVVRILDYIGKLSQPAFNIEDQLETLYIKAYVHSPELAKKLWHDHYGEIHHPYNLLKNRCFKMLDELDAEYIKRNKKYPPNWNI